jgi:hypothetical protein
VSSSLYLILNIHLQKIACLFWGNGIKFQVLFFLKEFNYNLIVVFQHKVDLLDNVLNIVGGSRMVTWTINVLGALQRAFGLSILWLSLVSISPCGFLRIQQGLMIFGRLVENGLGKINHKGGGSLHTYVGLISSP